HFRDTPPSPTPSQKVGLLFAGCCEAYGSYVCALVDESIASNVYAAIKQGMLKQRKDVPFYIIKKYCDVVFEII
ncbi:hypothetical protein PtrSN001C_011997, partial [Pyrenophora tritici-repentis]